MSQGTLLPDRSGVFRPSLILLSLIADYDYVFTGQCQCVSTLKGHTKNVSCVTVLPNGCIVSGSRDSTLRIWDPDSWKCILILQGDQKSVV